MKMVDVLPWRAYVCITFLREYIEGALSQINHMSAHS
jgi:hypothetical protein